MLSHYPTRRRFLGAAGLAGLGLFSARAEDPKAAATPKFGICSGLGKGRAMKEAGADYIEESVSGTLIPDEPEEAFLKKLEAIKTCGAPVLSYNGYIRRPELRAVGPEANHDKIMEYCKVALERAQRAGGRTIVFGSAGCRKIPDGWEPAKAMDQMVALLKLMAPVAADHGVVVAVEPLNAKECNFLNRIGEVAELASRVGHPGLRATADFYHMVKGGDTPDDLRKAMPFVHHVHIARQDGRKVPAPGGEDFVPFFKVMREASFQGKISIEAQGKPEEIAPAFTELRRQWDAAKA